ncbi:uncharacterized protein LOC129043489 [Pongo pygmaeus]|uniref:uncharacterized protein LOC129043489 n=1 Tax=Pongo pygmaeus TaxID=9600 RepID=UPI0023E2C9E8|nr:uncharacterized protein LOC129043489 [Pongo pygmaeus]
MAVAAAVTQASRREQASKEEPADTRAGSGAGPGQALGSRRVFRRRSLTPTSAAATASSSLPLPPRPFAGAARSTPGNALSGVAESSPAGAALSSAYVLFLFPLHCPKCRRSQCEGLKAKWGGKGTSGPCGRGCACALAVQVVSPPYLMRGWAVFTPPRCHNRLALPCVSTLRSPLGGGSGDKIAARYFVILICLAFDIWRGRIALCGGVGTMEMMLDKKQIRAIFLFKFKMGHKAAETTHNINNTFGSGTANERTVQWWFKKFRKGEESLEDEEHSGRPSEVDSDRLRAIIDADPLITTPEVAEELNIDHSTVVRHLKQIGKVKKLGKWVPRELSEKQKNCHSEVSSSLILCNNSEPFLDRIVMCHEKWILYDSR